MQILTRYDRIGFPLKDVMPEIKRLAMVSSTVLDLPDHRWEVREACLRQEIFPLMMESLTASDADAISVSLKMVDRADIYIAVFAYRYGHVPAGCAEDLWQLA